MNVKLPHSFPEYNALFKSVAVPTIFWKVITWVGLVATKLYQTSSSLLPAQVIAPAEAVAPVIKPGVTCTQSKPGFTTTGVAVAHSSFSIGSGVVIHKIESCKQSSTSSVSIYSNFIIFSYR